MPTNNSGPNWQSNARFFYWLIAILGTLGCAFLFGWLIDLEAGLVSSNASAVATYPSKLWQARIALTILGELLPTFLAVVGSWIFFGRYFENRRAEEQRKLIDEMARMLEGNGHMTQLTMKVNDIHTVVASRNSNQHLDELEDLLFDAKTKFVSIRDILNFFVMNTDLDYVAFMDVRHVDNPLTDWPNPKLADRLVQFGVKKSVDQQIEHFKKIAAGLHLNIDRLNDTFDELAQGVLIRTVFDVEQGGVFYYHIDDFPDTAYLFGATVNQYTMNDDGSDHAMRLLRETLLEFEAARGSSRSSVPNQ